VPAGGGDHRFGAPLAGVRVLDLSQIVAGPVCGRMLADLGAEVVKVEAPKGDGARVFPPFYDDGVSPYFAHMNAGKRAVCIDLRMPEGAALVARLAERSDVLLENFRPGVLTRYGLGADTLLERHPRLVYCSITGWGVDGPWSDRRAVAPIVFAEAGRIEQDARLRGRDPEQPVHVDGDLFPGFFAVSAILAALYQREHTGAGQHLDVAMADAVVYADEWASTDLAGYEGPRIPDQWTYPMGVTADGTRCAIVGDPVRAFRVWADALGGEDIAEPVDPADALAVILSLCAAVPDFATLEARLAPSRNMVGRVRSIGELADSDWAAHRRAFTDVEPGARVPTAPFRSRHAPIGVQGPPPRHGEHTHAVLSELLGLSDAELDALGRAGAIVQRPVR
jgi:crotonobetainyl-CoA:carnitine CoA-transferase CaiB-like acyl-CoA transferase